MSWPNQKFIKYPFFKTNNIKMLNGINNDSISVGFDAGYSNQGTSSIAIGNLAGYNHQNQNTIAIGSLAGFATQNNYAIAIGANAAQTGQGTFAIAIGAGNNATLSAGSNNQSQYAIAIGYSAGATGQNSNSIAIGRQAGQVNQGTNSIAIGTLAGSQQAANSIVISALGTVVTGATASATYISPIRNSLQSNFLYYNTTNNEIVYNSVAIGGCYNNYYVGPWATIDPPTPTSGVGINVPITGTYTITTNASAKNTVAINLMVIQVWINGVYTGYDIKGFTNESSSHKTLVPQIFIYTLNVGANYIYYKQTVGTSDANDFGSNSWVYSPY